MTREQKEKALAFLKDMQECTYDGIEEIRTVIECLEQQPSEDCVSRQAVVQWLENATDDSIEHAIDSNLEFIPPVTPTQRWIPVSERLPKTDGDYLLFGKVDEDEENYIFVGEYDSCGEQFGIWVEQFDRTTLGCLGSEFYEYASVLAWMPLPEPYKAEKEDE